MKREPKIIIRKPPDVNKIMETICYLLTQQSGGEYEYTYTLNADKEEKQNA